MVFSWRSLCPTRSSQSMLNWFSLCVDTLTPSAASGTRANSPCLTLLPRYLSWYRCRWAMYPSAFDSLDDDIPPLAQVVSAIGVFLMWSEPPPSWHFMHSWWRWEAPPILGNGREPSHVAAFSYQRPAVLRGIAAPLQACKIDEHTAKHGTFHSRYLRCAHYTTLDATYHSAFGQLRGCAHQASDAPLGSFTAMWPAGCSCTCSSGSFGSAPPLKCAAEWLAWSSWCR